MLQLQEAEDRKTPAATTWCAKFLLRAEESREFLGSLINSGAIHEAKKTSDASNHVLFPMWKEATNDWSTSKFTMRALQKRKKTWTGSD